MAWPKPTPEIIEARRVAKAAREREKRAAMTPEQKAAYNAAGRKRAAKRYDTMDDETRRARWRKSAERLRVKRAEVKTERQRAEAIAFAARATKLKADNRTAFVTTPDALYARARKAIPYGYPEDVREDVANDMVIALLDGELAADEIEKRARQYIAKHYKARDWFTAVSYDAPKPGHEGKTYKDFI